MILMTGFTGKVGFEVGEKLKSAEMNMICGVRNVSREQNTIEMRIHLSI